MRRHLGTQVPEIQDAPGVEAVIVQVFRSIAEALDKYVPWYRLSEITSRMPGATEPICFC